MPGTQKIFYNAVAKTLLGDYKKIAALKKNGASWEEIFSSLPGKPDKEKLWAELTPSDTNLILAEEDAFPKELLEIPHPPFALYYRGSLPSDGTRIGVVGTRKATPEGEDLAYEISRSLAAKGVTVVSGLAFGIDSAAHKGALSTGKTIAVLATGVDDPYPAANKKLAEQILGTDGTLFSEYPPGSPALPHRFLERNRIVSGLSKAIMVIEAPQRSGSLATARFALEQNRDVFVAPGPAGHRNYSGSHALIREGARLATCAEEILEDLELAPVQKTLFEGTPEEDLVLSILAVSKPMQFDEIAEMAKLETTLLARVLNSLVIAGKIEEKDNGYQIS